MAIQRLDTDGERAPELLFERHHDEIRTFLRRRIPANLFALCWLENHGVRPLSDPELFAFRGIRNGEGELRAVSLVITERLALIDALEPELARRFGRWFYINGIAFDHVVSTADSVEPFWEAYCEAAGRASDELARLIRDQTMFVLKRADWYERIVEQRERPEPSEIRYAALRDLDPLFLASAHMHREETLEDPLEEDPDTFRNHVRHRVESNRSFVWFDQNRRLIFKADLSAQGEAGVQISGVYTDPQLRGRGIATRGMYDICSRLFDEGVPRIVLYVNRDNAPAKRVYRKVGFEEYTDYQTVFVASDE
ncbi:MAG: GNAT family N-acetyltransferase [Bradymonadaceae bacterium]